MRVGIIGVGHMGHGIALNVLKGGFPLVMLDHPGNQPVHDLIDLGATQGLTPGAVASEVDLVILCVSGSPQVEAVLTGDTGVIASLKPGSIVVDCSTSLPASTARMAALVAAAGSQYLDAPMTRLAKQAHEGTLNILVGGETAVLDAARPVLNTFTENIDHVGALGFGHAAAEAVGLGCEHVSAAVGAGPVAGPHVGEAASATATVAGTVIAK